LSEDFKASVTVSRLWDGKRVGQELVDKIKQDDVDPDFILLFSTIHYEGEFQKFLDIVKDEFPDAPLVGGTVAGFMSQQGCYTRGVSAMAVEYEDMEVSYTIGHNTKGKPKSKAKKCSKEIREELKDSEHDEKLVFMFTSGSEMPSIPGLGSKRVYNSKVASFLASKLLWISSKLFGKGVGKEEIVLKNVSEELPEFKIIGGSTTDNNKMASNFQFFDKKVSRNSLVLLAVGINKNVYMTSEAAVEKTEEELKIKKGSKGYIIKEIDDNYATEKLLERFNWPKEFLNESLHRKTFFYPLIFEKEGEIFPEVMGVIIGNKIICGYEIDSERLFLGRTSGQTLLETIDKVFGNTEIFEKADLNFTIYCSALLEAIGKDFFNLRESITENLGETPFLLIATSGEDFRVPGNIPKHTNETINAATFL